MRSALSLIKLISFVVLTLLIIPLQATWLFLFKKTNYDYGLIHCYGKLTCWIFGIKIKLIGTPSEHKKLVFVGNHISYIDIITLGSFLKATFIAKSEVADWPLFGTLAQISNTVFIKRTREAAPQAIIDIKESIHKGTSLILFPEGTTTIGKEVLPFKTTMFDLFLLPDLKNDLLLQPFTILITGVDGRPIGTDADLDAYAWYGDMTMLPHLWELGKRKSINLQITMHATRAALDYDDRKKLANDCHSDVEQGMKISCLPPLI